MFSFFFFNKSKQISDHFGVIPMVNGLNTLAAVIMGFIRRRGSLHEHQTSTSIDHNSHICTRTAHIALRPSCTVNNCRQRLLLARMCWRGWCAKDARQSISRVFVFTLTSTCNCQMSASLVFKAILLLANRDINY